MQIQSYKVANCHALHLALFVSLHFLKKTSSLDLSGAGGDKYRGKGVEAGCPSESKDQLSQPLVIPYM